MSSIDAAKERKRRARALPPTLEGRSAGCLLAVVAYVGACIGVFRATQTPFFLVLAVPGLLVLVATAITLVREVMLLSMVRRRWTPQGIRCLVVHSDSPNWAEHISTRWLPRIGQAAVTLNWSQRRTWPRSLEVAVFESFCKASRNFNPAVVVFRGLKQPFVFRFYYAFEQARNGRPEYLETLESQLFNALDV